MSVDIASCANLALQKLRCYNGIMNKNSIHDLSDEQLVNAVKAVATVERKATAHLIALLAEMDATPAHFAARLSGPGRDVSDG